jgi:hypothetical protein
MPSPLWATLGSVKGDAGLLSLFKISPTDDDLDRSSIPQQENNK